MTLPNHMSFFQVLSVLKKENAKISFSGGRHHIHGVSSQGIQQIRSTHSTEIALNTFLLFQGFVFKATRTFPFWLFLSPVFYFILTCFMT